MEWIMLDGHLDDFQKPPSSWEVGLIQNRKIMALQMLTTVGLFYLIMCEDLHE